MGGARTNYHHHRLLSPSTFVPFSFLLNPDRIRAGWGAGGRAPMRWGRRRAPRRAVASGAAAGGTREPPSELRPRGSDGWSQVRPCERGWCELPGERSLGGAARRAKIPASRGPGGAADRATSRRVANPGKWWDTVRTNFFF
jgi:hypothetical protein